MMVSQTHLLLDGTGQRHWLLTHTQECQSPRMLSSQATDAQNAAPQTAAEVLPHVLITKT